MYRLSKLAHVPDQIELPNCMYHLDRQYQWEDKDLAEEYYGNTRAPQGQDNVSELATRQEAVLKKLQQLKLQVDQLQGSNVPSTGVKGSVVTANAAAAAQAPQMQNISTRQKKLVAIISSLREQVFNIAEISQTTQQDFREELDLESHQKYLLKKLGSLREHLSTVIKVSDVSGKDNISYPRTLAERQSTILEVIHSLRDEMKKFVKNQDVISIKEAEPELDLDSHHCVVLSKLKLLREELNKFLKGLQNLAWEEVVLPDLLNCNCNRTNSGIPLILNVMEPTNKKIGKECPNCMKLTDALLNPLTNCSEQTLSISESCFNIKSNFICQNFIKVISLETQNPFPTNKSIERQMSPSVVSQEQIRKSSSKSLKSSKAALQSGFPLAGVVHDVVISAKPSAAPYSLVLIKMLLRDAGISVYCASHVHSTVHKVESELSSAFCDVGSGERSQHNLAFTVLWKDTQQPQLMVSPMSQTRVCGEANIVRYLSRLFPATSMYNYEAASSFCCIAETDQLMDQLQAQLADGNKKEKQAALRQLNGKLGGARFLLGDQLSIIDILAWSLVKQMDDGASAPTNVAKWYKSINSLLEPDNKNHQVNEAQKRVHQNDSDSKNSKKQKMSLTPVKKEKSPLKESNAQNSPVPSLPPSSMNKSHMDRTGFQNYLQKNGIKYQVQDHKEVFTVEALMQCVPDMPGLHMKNLFLKDKKKNLYLLSTRHDAKVSLNDVAKKLGTKDLRFGDETVMKDILGVGQGCVTAFALVNDTKHQVVMAIDEEATNGVHQYINFHPMSNAATLGVSPADLQKFFTLTGHKPTLLKFE